MTQLSHHHANQILAVVEHYMDMGLRGKIMDEAPQAYNAWMEQEIVKVVSTDEESHGPWVLKVSVEPEPIT